MELWRKLPAWARWLAVGVAVALAVVVAVRLLGAAGGLLVALLSAPAAYQRQGDAQRRAEGAARAARRASVDAARVSGALAEAARASADADAAADRAIAAPVRLLDPPQGDAEDEPAFLRALRERGGEP